MRSILLFILLFLLNRVCIGQPQASNWFFSPFHGLTFASGNPAYITGKLAYMEGGSAISDASGQLLFYTDGMTVFNRQQQIMLNGEGLAGGSGSSTQSSIIVPKTRDGNQYYIFTTDEEGASKGLQYSIVDMRQDGGNGEVTVKNTPLVTPTSEQVTAVMHCDKKGYWVITHQYDSDAFYSYLVRDTGVNQTPVISHTGAFLPVAYGTMSGSLKASPDGKKLVAAHGTIGVDLLDFDNRTGVVSNGRNIFLNANSLPYGVEFSVNSSLVYLSVTHYWDDIEIGRFSGVFQLDLTQPDVTSIINSTVQLAKYPQGNEMGVMQRGPDGKIYMAQFLKNYLSVINSPSTLGTGCGFVTEGFPLPQTGRFNVPNLVNEYYGQLDDFTIYASGFCLNQPVSFNYNTSGGVSSVLWDFDDPLSGTANQSAALSPSHIFSVAGLHRVKLVKYGNCSNDTLTKDLTIIDNFVHLGNDTGFCDNEGIILTATSPPSNTFLWNTGATSTTLSVSIAGQYWVQATNASGCVVRDTVSLSTKPAPVVYIGADTSLCNGESFQLNAGNDGATYKWQDGSTGQTLIVNNPGLYSVEVTSAGCKASAAVHVLPIQKPDFSLGPDRVICPDNPVLLDPGVTGQSYLWQDGSSDREFLASQEGTYFVEIVNACGAATDSITLVKGACNVYVPSAFSPNNDGVNDYFRISGGYTITQFSLKVYNRWGQLVFTTEDRTKGWNGMVAGKKALAGVYIYLISYSDLSAPAKQSLKGTVTLIR